MVDLTNRDEKLLELLKGRRLCVERPPSGEEEKLQRRFFIEPGGYTAHKLSAQKLIDGGFVVPVGDALFPGMTQTYELAE